MANSFFLNKKSLTIATKYNIIVLYNTEGKTMANKDFSRIIRKLRVDAKLTMDDLANKVGVKKSTISMWENSNVVPRDDILIKLSAIFDVSIDYLLGNINRGAPSNTKLEYIQRNLEKLDEKKLSQAESVLKAVFTDIFEEEEDHNGL